MRKIFNPSRIAINGDSGNVLKTRVQNDANDELDKYGQLVAEFTTGFGKTNVAVIAIKRRRGKRVNIIVPTDALYKQWAKVLAANGLIGEHINIYVINTFTMSPDKVDVIDPDLTIIDEGHRCLNEQSMYFSQLIQMTPNSEKLILSASLDAKHKDFLDELGINIYYMVTRNWAFRHGLVPYHTAMNIPIDLTPIEMSDYLVAQDVIDSESKFFSSLGVYDPYGKYNAEGLAARRGIPVGAIYGKMKKWRNAYDTRKKILYNAENKKAVLAEMMPYINEKCLIFCKTIDQINNLAEQDELAGVYHSKQKKKEHDESLKNFLNNLFPHLYSADSLKEGFDVPDCRVVVRAAYDKGERDTIQITGRAARFDENNLDKESYLFNLVVRNFKARGREILSKEMDWLTSNQKSEYNVVWFEQADDAINFVKEKFGNHETA